MSSWADITIDGMLVLETQNYYHEWYFKKTERTIEQVSASKYYDELVAPADLKVKRHIYKTSAESLRRRLDLAGYNRDSLEQEFKEQKKQLLFDLDAMLDLDPSRVIRYIEPVRNSTLDIWLSCLFEIKSSLADGIIKKWKQPSDPTLKEFMLGTDIFFSCHPTPGSYSFPCMSEEGYAVALLELTEDSAECILDVTDLVSGGWTQAFDDLIEFNQDHTKFYEVFSTSVDDIRAMVSLAPENSTLARLLYAAVITAMETYLSDTLKKQVLNREGIKRKFIRNHDTLKDKKISMSLIFERMAGLNEEIISEIDRISFHNLDKIPGLYKSVLSTKFPETGLAELSLAVNNRHDIVHRNGKNTSNKPLNISMSDVEDLINLVDNCILHIDKQIQDGLLDDADVEQAT